MSSTGSVFDEKVEPWQAPTPTAWAEVHLINPRSASPDAQQGLRRPIAARGLRIPEQAPRRIQYRRSHIDPTEIIFREHATRWKKEVALTSSLSEMVTNPSYLRIIGLGKPVVPYLLAELRDEPNHWFVALHAITGINPVRVEDQGRFRAMVSAWLKWGRDGGLI